MKDVSITLVNESCFSFLKELESNSIDLALIDPPYEVSRETNFKSGEAKGKDTDRFRVSMDFGDWDSDFTGLNEVIKELYRVLRKGGTLICFYDIWKISILRRYFDDAKFRQIRLMQTDNKVLISNITSDKVVGKDIIDGWLHHFVCDKTYPNGKVVKQTMCVLADETFKEVQKKGYYKKEKRNTAKKTKD